MQVIARGRVTVYDERGDLQFQAEHLEPKGAGALQIAFEQLKAKLAAEGLFEQARKKPVPVLPRRIGLVTSPRGAAVQDILNILRRRHESVNVLIYPAQVQGEVAASEVSAGVRYFNRHGHVDVIIVARGGGSFEDLFAFNDEGLARVDCSVCHPGDLRHRARDRFHHLRFCRGPARAHSIGCGGAGHPLQARARGEAARLPQAHDAGHELQTAAGQQRSVRDGAARGFRAHDRTALPAASSGLTSWCTGWRNRSRAC